MIILFDATMIKPEQAGIRTYALGLARALARQPETRVIVVTARDNDDDWGECQVSRTSLSRQNVHYRLAWRHRFMAGIVRREGADVVLVPAPEPVAIGAVPQAIVVHDIGPLLAPGIYGWTRFMRYLFTLRRSVRTVQAVFTPSHTTKLELDRWLGPIGTPSYVAGAELVPTSPGVIAGVDSSHINQQREDFALYVGALLPHKNIRTVISAFETARKGLPSRLVIVGPRYGPEVEQTLGASREKGLVEHRGYVSAEELDSLYARARVVVFPSLSEGFGLPILEALCRGATVIASDIPVSREVGGNNVTYVSQPTDPGAWADAMAQSPVVDTLTNQQGRIEPLMSGVISWASCATEVRTRLGQF